jgi:DNA-3-methyladenine glycosylase
MTSHAKLPREFYLRPDVLTVAKDLLGKLLVVPGPKGERVSGKIVEVEAYRGPEDRASHAYGGRCTKRTRTMYGSGGVAYVYFVYGMYYQFNVVSNVADTPHAILVRALEPVEGIEIMRERRHTQPDYNLTSGPGKLCIAMGIDRALDGADLLGDRVWLEEFETLSPRRIAKGPRIGIDYAQEWITKPWRFWIKNNTYVSRK